jgi:hypothetical protein
MASCDDVRKFALALAGVSELDHWGRPAFRTKKRIFITLRPQEQKAMFHIPEEHQELLFEMRPDTFEPLHWDKVTRCFVNLGQVSAVELEALVREACEYVSCGDDRKSRATRSKSDHKPAPRRPRKPG